MMEINKKPLLVKHSLQIDANKIQKLSSFNNLTTSTGKEYKLGRTPKKCLNIEEFIKQKNKFFIEDSFNPKGTREFLASKEVAMREIKLNDEIIEIKKAHLTNKNLIKLDFMINEDNIKNSKVANRHSISPSKMRKTHKKFSKELGIELEFGERKKSKKLKKSPKKLKDRRAEIESKNSSNIDSSKNYNEKKEKDFQNNIDNNPIDNSNREEENYSKHKKKKKMER